MTIKLTEILVLRENDVHLFYYWMKHQVLMECNVKSGRIGVISEKERRV